MSSESKEAGPPELLPDRKATDVDGGSLSATGSARRRFLIGSGAITGGIAASRYAAAAAPSAVEVRDPASSVRSVGQARTVHLSVNQQDYAVDLEPFRLMVLGIFPSEHTGVGFYVLSDQASFSKHVLLDAGLRAGIEEDEP